MPCALWKGLVGWAEIESESLVPACTSSSSQRNSHLLREIHVCVEGDDVESGRMRGVSLVSLLVTVVSLVTLLVTVVSLVDNAGPHDSRPVSWES